MVASEYVRACGRGHATQAAALRTVFSCLSPRLSQSQTTTQDTEARRHFPFVRSVLEHLRTVIPVTSPYNNELVSQLASLPVLPDSTAMLED